MNINDNSILSHTTWNRKYHIVFASKYLWRRKKNIISTFNGITKLVKKRINILKHLQTFKNIAFYS